LEPILEIGNITKYYRNAIHNEVICYLI